MRFRSPIALTLFVLGGLGLLLAAISLGLGLYESATIPASRYKDPALGYTLAPVFAVIGLALAFAGRGVEREHRD